MCSARTLVAAWTLFAVVVAMGAGASAGAASPTARAAEHFACSKRNSAHIPCYFSTPAGNIRCMWTPASQAVVCESLARRRGFVLHPTGRAKAVRPALAHRGETLPTNQQILFPQSLSCRDTRNSITCNQDEGTGFFTIGPKGLRSG